MTLADLQKQLAWAKAQESAARDARIAAEEAILAHPDVVAVLKDEGSVTVEGVRVTTGYTRAWDQGVLQETAKQVSPEYWPFKAEWKEDRRRTRDIEANTPDLWALISPALTVKPKKAAVALVGEAE